jgi:ABC-type phosphate transport system substrate-binding protein
MRNNPDRHNNKTIPGQAFVSSGLALVFKTAFKNAFPIVFSTLFTLLLPAKAFADLAIIVNPQNPVTTLSDKQIAKIFMGRLRMFPDTKLDAEVVDQPENQATFSNFYLHIVKMNPTKLKRYRASYLFSGQGNLPTELESDDAVKSYIATTPTAIGYIESAHVDATVKVVYRIPAEALQTGSE